MKKQNGEIIITKPGYKGQITITKKPPAPRLVPSKTGTIMLTDNTISTVGQKSDEDTV